MTELIRQWGAWLDASGWADVVGLVASVVGIADVPFAVWNAWRAKRAAQAAREAAQEASSRLGRYESATRLNEITSRLASIRALQNQEQWYALVEMYAETRRSLIAVRAGNTDLNASQAVVLQDSVALLGRLEYELDAALAGGQMPANMAENNQLLAERLDAIHQLSHELGRATIKG